MLLPVAWFPGLLPAAQPLQGGPDPAPHAAWTPLQLLLADVYDRISQLTQKRCALLLTLPQARLRQQLHDQRTLATHVRDDERTDLALRAEAMRMQRGGLQEPAQLIVGGGRGVGAGSGAMPEKAGEHARRLAPAAGTMNANISGECREIAAGKDQRQSRRDVEDHNLQTGAEFATNAPTRRCPAPRWMQRGSCAHCTA